MKVTEEGRSWTVLSDRIEYHRIDQIEYRRIGSDLIPPVRRIGSALSKPILVTRGSFENPTRSVTELGKHGTPKRWTQSYTIRSRMYRRRFLRFKAFWKSLADLHNTLPASQVETIQGTPTKLGRDTKTCTRTSRRIHSSATRSGTERQPSLTPDLRWHGSPFFLLPAMLQMDQKITLILLSQTVR